MSETVTLNLPDDVIFQLMLNAHEQDITLNQLVNNILKEELEKEHPFSFLQNNPGTPE